MDPTQKIIIIPGAYDLVKNYGGYSGIDIWLGENKEKNEQKLREAEWIFAASSGPNYVLASPAFKNQKLILLNPLVKKRGPFSMFVRCVRFMLAERLPMRKLIPSSRYVFALRRLYHLLQFDTLSALRKLPKDQFIIIRGKHDKFFCDDESVAIMKREGFRYIEVDAGHIWNQNVADAVKNILVNVNQSF